MCSTCGPPLPSSSGRARRRRSSAALPDDVPERYDDASPIEHLPLGVPVLCVHGRDDTNVPIGQSERFVAAAQAAGDDATLEIVDGDHFVVIDPAAGAWAAVLGWLDERRR